MIEDYGLPRWEEIEGHTRILANNALTLRTARALIGDTPLSTDPYDKGIGFDPMYPARRFGQGIAEAAACGATMVVKGTEYVEDGAFTLLTAERFAPQRQAIGHIHRWLADHADLYRERQNVARVGLLHPGDALWQNWDRLAPLYFGAGQALLAAGIPWRVVALQGDTGESAAPDQTVSELAGLDLLLCFEQGPPEAATPPHLRVVSVPDLPGWNPSRPSFLAWHRSIRSAASRVVNWLFQSYFRWGWSRQLVDRSGLVHFFWQTPFFRLPPPAAREALLAALGHKPYPRVMAGAPVLAELWQRGEEWQLHLVNYAPEPQPVTVEFGHLVQGAALSPDGGEERTASKFRGTSWESELDLYTVLQYRPKDPG
jgi:hypothetical protein